MPEESPKATIDETTTIPYPFTGVFSEIVTKSVGFGATKRKEKIKKLWFLERDEQGTTFIRPLSKSYLPSGDPAEIPLARAIKNFFPEPNIYMTRVAPKMAEVEAAVTKGDEHRSQDEHYSAEFAYKEALSIDEFHIRANFGLALTYASMGDKEKAKHTFRTIVTLEGSFNEKHKHLFNEFGIALRKNEMYRESLEYYLRALRLCKSDENLLFNLARACYDNDSHEHAVEFLDKALALKPDFKEAMMLKKAIGKIDPSLLEPQEQDDQPPSDEATNGAA
ncbi:tetratricopeptide repeat protein [Desulfovibrio ferrophilus]|uniref:Uncharacterized protein n=1 Tax=Desulfovibrio ferrophilus TaxID=241368 RepID=A0A2Z6AUF3_9BACT|nr:tetratricopeptide repeat protein [Desulfovibrio ferrophilus]BBD06816.1 uncharacterized protein DFE_0090 [Desulfovibrio ferrophilus]